MDQLDSRTAAVGQKRTYAESDADGRTQATGTDAAGLRKRLRVDDVQLAESASDGQDKARGTDVNDYDDSPYDGDVSQSVRKDRHPSRSGKTGAAREETVARRIFRNVHFKYVDLIRRGLLLSFRDTAKIQKIQHFSRAKARASLIQYCATHLYEGLEAGAQFKKLKQKAFWKGVHLLLLYSNVEKRDDAFTISQTIPCNFAETALELDADTLRDHDSLDPAVAARLLEDFYRSLPELEISAFAEARANIKAAANASALSSREIQENIHTVFPENSGTISTSEGEIKETPSPLPHPPPTLAEGSNAEPFRATPAARTNENSSDMDLTYQSQETSPRPPEPVSPPPPPPPPPPLSAAASVKLRDLSDWERGLQRRYWGISHDEDLAICPRCCAAGHMSDTCPFRYCKHCGAFERHLSSACPTIEKCSRCRSHGHGAEECRSKLVRSAVDGFSCDICNGNHKEEDCSWLWRTFKLRAEEAPRKVSSMLVDCYECGVPGHWGDDCITRPKNKAKHTNVFSAEYANQFLNIDSLDVAYRQSARGRKTYPDVKEDEDLGDAQNFYGNNVNVSQPSHIHFNTQWSGSASHGNVSVPSSFAQAPNGRYSGYRPPERPIDRARRNHVSQPSHIHFNAQLSGPASHGSGSAPSRFAETPNGRYSGNRPNEVNTERPIERARRNHVQNGPGSRYSARNPTFGRGGRGSYRP